MLGDVQDFSTRSSPEGSGLMMNRTLSPKDLARAVDVSESSLKRWADSGTIRATRTAGGHRRIALSEAIRFIRESKLSLVNPEALGLRDLGAAPTPELGSAKDDRRFLEHLEKGATQAARGFVLWKFLRGESVAAICDGPILHAMDALGGAWKGRPDGIFLEHRATDICLQALDQLRVLAEVPNEAPVVLGGAPSGDPYILPSVMAATSLVFEGLDAVNLGPDTPANSLVSAAEHYDVSTVWLSITSSNSSRAELERYLDELVTTFPRPVTVVVGGRSSHKIRNLNLPGVHHGESMAELVAFARGRFGRPGYRRGGRDYRD
jgi:excisionase family DNA binding protein